jgi:membrane fusion protein (multidrug efflux system)
MAAFALAASVGVGLAAWAAAASLAAGGWRGLFWVQAGLGALYVLLALRVLRGERGDLDSLRRADWPSFLLLSTGLGLLAVFLGEGERRFWFETWWITAALVCGLAGVGFAARSLVTARDPLLRLDVFAKPTFTWAIVLQVVYRFGLMLAVVVVPQYLGRLQGYRVEQLAGALLPLAGATAVFIPIAYWMSVKLDARLALSLGLGLFATAAWIGRDLAPDWAAPEFLRPMLLAGAGQALFGVATLRFATFDIARHEGPTLGVLFNFARIFGLVGGLAVVSHLIVEREKFHSARAVERLSAADPLLAQRLAGQAASFAAWIPDPGQDQRAALAGLGRAAGAQAFTLAYADAFTILALLLLAGTVLVWALPRLPDLPASPRPASNREPRMTSLAPSSPPASPGHTFKTEPVAVARHAARRVVLAAAVLALLGGAVAGGYALWGGVTPFESTDNAYVRGDLTFVATKVSGYVAEVVTENNRRVRPGEVLVRIDPRDYQAAVRDAEATLAQQRAAGLQIQALKRLQLAQIEIGDAAVTAAAAQVERTTADFRRTATLVDSGVVSRALYDQNSADNVRAVAALAQARAQAGSAREQLAVLDAQAQANVAAQAGAEAKLAKARNDLDATVLTAPREGLVAARNVRAGEYVGVGARLMAVTPTRALWIEANLRETQLARIRPGDRVQVRVDAVPGRPFCGVVESLSGASGSEFSVIPPDNATGNFTKIVRRFPVRILLDPGQPGLERLGAGMSVEPRIAIGSHTDGRAHGWGPLSGRFDCARPDGARA